MVHLGVIDSSLSYYSRIVTLCLYSLRTRESLPFHFYFHQK